MSSPAGIYVLGQTAPPKTSTGGIKPMQATRQVTKGTLIVSQTHTAKKMSAAGRFGDGYMKKITPRTKANRVEVVVFKRSESEEQIARRLIGAASAGGRERKRVSIWAA